MKVVLEVYLSNIQPVSKMRHADKRWRRYKNYDFAARDATAPVVVAEFAKACVAFPLAFVKSPEGLAPIAVLGLSSGRNLFVARNGRWVGGYVPAAYRGYPFRLGKTQEDQKFLCVDEDSGLIHGPSSDNGSADQEGEAFFDAQGGASAAVKEVLGFLSQVDENRSVTVDFCNLLEVHGLIEPWPIVLKNAGGEQKIEGLFRVSEVEMRKLKSRALGALHKENALMPAYCQILSMQTFPILGQLAEAHERAKTSAEYLPPPAPSGEIDFSFLRD